MKGVMTLHSFESKYDRPQSRNFPIKTDDLSTNNFFPGTQHSRERKFLFWSLSLQI